jgi:hypothetical protein
LNIDNLVKAATARVETVRVIGTAMNPALWLVGIVSPLAFLLSVFAGESWLRPALFVVGVVPLALAVIAYFLLLFRDPDRLQSEEYRLRQRELIIYEKGANAEIVDPGRETPRVEHLPRGFVDGDEQ